MDIGDFVTFKPNRNSEKSAINTFGDIWQIMGLAENALRPGSFYLKPVHGTVEDCRWVEKDRVKKHKDFS